LHAHRNFQEPNKVLEYSIIIVKYSIIIISITNAHYNYTVSIKHSIIIIILSIQK
jgi:hypothetical protein